MNAHQLNANSVIINTIVVSALDQFPGLIDATLGGRIGDSFIGGVIVPQVDQVIPRFRWITKFAFRGRFTQAEKVLLEMASLDNAAAPALQRQMAASIRVNLADTAAAEFIDLDLVETRNGLFNLEAGGLLGSGRALEILDTAITEIEYFNQG